MTAAATPYIIAILAFFGVFIYAVGGVWLATEGPGWLWPRKRRKSVKRGTGRVAAGTPAGRETVSGLGAEVAHPGRSV